MPTGKEIVATLRTKLGDEVEPYLWSPAFLLDAANQAEREAVRRTLSITDDTTTVDAGTKGVCVVTLGVGTAGYVLSSLVLQVLRVKLPSDAVSVAAGTSGYDVPLVQKTRDELDKELADWENLEGTPWGFITEIGNELRLVPKPTTAMTARLVVKRLPLVDFTLLTSPEFYSEHMLHWAQALAYQVPDSETLNLPLAQYHEQRFEAFFGPVVSYRDQQTRRQIARGASFRYRPFGS
jgi:hypothetical protein